MKESKKNSARPKSEKEAFPLARFVSSSSRGLFSSFPAIAATGWGVGQSSSPTDPEPVRGTAVPFRFLESVVPASFPPPSGKPRQLCFCPLFDCDFLLRIHTAIRIRRRTAAPASRAEPSPRPP